MSLELLFRLVGEIVMWSRNGGSVNFVKNAKMNPANLQPETKMVKNKFSG